MKLDTGSAISFILQQDYQRLHKRGELAESLSVYKSIHKVNRHSPRCYYDEGEVTVNSICSISML